MRNLKKVFALVTVFLLIFSMTAFAGGEVNTQDEATFDLDSSTDIQSATIMDREGNTCVITLERNNKPMLFSSDYLAMGTYTYTIRFTGGTINLSYDIDIQHDMDSGLKAIMSNIGNANYTTFLGSVKKESLKINRSKETASSPAMATYKVWMESLQGSGSTTMSLIARAQKGKLTVKTK